MAVVGIAIGLGFLCGPIIGGFTAPDTAGPSALATGSFGLNLFSKSAAIAGADALVVVTDWNEYRFPDFAKIKSALKRPIVIDGRNLYDPDKMAQLGFTYRSVGRGRE